MSTSFTDKFNEVNVCDESNSADLYPESTFSRKDLSGGKGVFSNFFDELADTHQYKLGFNEMNNVCGGKEINDHFHNQIFELYKKEIEDNFYDENPMGAFYARNADDDLKFIDNCRVLFDHENSYANDYSFQQNDLSGLAGNTSGSRIAANYGQLGIENPFGLSYGSRIKPPKVLVNRYLLGSTIGQGSYGKVKDALDLVTLRRHAVKIMSKLGVRKIPGGWNQALNEARIMRSLPPCRHIVSLIQALHLDGPERMCLVMEHCLGSVHDLQASGVPSPLTPQNASLPSYVVGLSQQSPAAPPVANPHLAMQVRNFSQSGDLLCRSPVRRTVSAGRKFSHVERTPKSLLFDGHEDGGGSGVCCYDGDDNGGGEQESSRHQAAQQQQFRRLPEVQAHAYFLQLIDALAFLHRNGVIHRDIKPANLLLTPAPGCGLNEMGSSVDLSQHDWLTDSNGTRAGSFGPRSLTELVGLSRGWLVKLTDFGVSAAVSIFAENYLVSGSQTTPAVQAPEVAKGVESTFDGSKLDIYSAGVTLYFMLTGHVPFSCQNVLQIFEAIVKGHYVIPSHVTDSAADLIRKLMEKDPATRLTLHEIRQHQWYINDPVPSTHIDEIKQQLRIKKTSTAFSKVVGTCCWLDPYVYLRRSVVEYAAPHIDDTGARIFSTAEIEGQQYPDQIQHDTMCFSDAADIDASPKLADPIDPDTPVAPMTSIVERLKVYHEVGYRLHQESCHVSQTPSTMFSCGQLELPSASSKQRYAKSTSGINNRVHSTSVTDSRPATTERFRFYSGGPEWSPSFVIDHPHCPDDIPVSHSNPDHISWRLSQLMKSHDELPIEVSRHDSPTQPLPLSKPRVSKFRRWFAKIGRKTSATKDNLLIPSTKAASTKPGGLQLLRRRTLRLFATYRC